MENTMTSRSSIGHAVLTLVVSLFAGTVSQAQDVTSLYSATDLQAAADVYTPNIRALWDEDLLPRLSQEERQRAGPVTLQLPLVGMLRSPLAFYSDPDERLVVLPIATVKFLDDLSVAYAYEEMMGCDQGLVSDYSAALHWRSDVDMGPPLTALGIPQSALQAPYVKKVAANALKSIVFFVAVHEYAHVMYRHKGYSLITAQQAQQQEIEADLFALDVMRRIGLPPVALGYFFLTSARIEASPGDFDSLADYEGYLHDAATHPLSTSRLLRVADAIQAHYVEFARIEDNPQAVQSALLRLVPDLREIATGLDDRRMRLFLVDRARNTDPVGLRSACKR
jgi:hypothetical protein